MDTLEGEVASLDRPGQTDLAADEGNWAGCLSGNHLVFVLEEGHHIEAAGSEVGCQVGSICHRWGHTIDTFVVGSANLCKHQYLDKGNQEGLLFDKDYRHDGDVLLQTSV
jgi:hypothetical protein